MPQKWFLVALMSLGVVLVIIGLFRGILESRQVQVEYLEGESSVEEAMIFVDVEGGVESPGVYELPSGSRVKDALVAAGGLSSNANRESFVKIFNLAQRLVDGQKIYVPTLNDTTGVGYISHETQGKFVNINDANLSELDTLEGIGPARAQDIINGRPYSNIEELASKGILSQSVLNKIRDSISVY